jgi:hypothetical protein
LFPALLQCLPVPVQNFEHMPQLLFRSGQLFVGCHQFLVIPFQLRFNPFYVQ